MVGARTTVKLVTPLVPVPEGVVMVSGPLSAVGGTAAVICVDPKTEMFAAGVAPKRTAVAPLKALPVMVTIVPGTPRAGWNPSIDGVTAKLPALGTEPAGSPTVILPLVAPTGTTTRSEVAERIVTELAAVPLKLTLFTVARFAPVTVTAVPIGPAAGAKLLIVGARITTKSDGLVAMPAGVVTTTRPVTAVAGTVVVIVLASTTVKVG
jgi:hypothetical protein